MMRWLLRVWGRFSLAAVVWAVARHGVIAQAMTPEKQDNTGTVVDRQDTVRQRVARLEDRMFEISQALRKSDPDKAARLVESLGASRGLAVQKQLEEIVARLREEQYSDAAERQEKLLADLQTILKQMIEEPNRLEDRKEEIDRLRSAHERLDALVKEQAQQRDEAQAAAMTPQDIEKLRAAIAQAQSLLDRQHALTDDASKNPNRAAELADRQASLRAETENVKKGVESLPGQPARPELESAATRMKAAEDWFRKDQSLDAEEAQQDAEESLRSAIQRLQEAEKQLNQNRPLEEQASRQAQIAEKTKHLADDLRSGKAGGSDSPPEDGSGQQDGEEAPQPDGQKQAGPNAEDVASAGRSQEEATRKLEENNPSEAVKHQNEALNKLENARKEAEEALEQLRKEQQEEMLAALEARFRAMLARQQEISRGTQRLADLPRSEWKRSDELALNDLAQGQAAVADQADKAHYILTEDGSTVVFPQMVEQVREDAHDAAARLADNQVTTLVRQIQSGIEQALNELLDAVKKQQEQMENEKQGQSSGGQEGPQPLLPGSAELKLLRACQLRVNQATQAIRGEVAKPAADPTREHLQKLTKRQAEVAEMAREMHEAMTKAQ